MSSAVATPAAAASNSAAAPASLTLVRTYHASCDRIFSAWTDPEQVARWFGPAPGFRAVVKGEPRMGGSYSIRMHNPNGTVHTAIGTYKEFNPPSKLVMSWQWEENDSANGSTLTIELRDLGGNSTELTLTHAQLPTEESRANHEKGWLGCMHSLGAYIDPEHTGAYAGPATACS